MKYITVISRVPIGFGNYHTERSVIGFRSVIDIKNYRTDRFGKLPIGIGNCGFSIGHMIYRTNLPIKKKVFFFTLETAPGRTEDPERTAPEQTKVSSFLFFYFLCFFSFRNVVNVPFFFRRSLGTLGLRHW